MLYNFQSGRPDWRRTIALAADRQDGFGLDQIASNVDIAQGHIAEASKDAEHGALRARDAKLTDSAANILATLAMNLAQFDDCQRALPLARRALTMDHSVATIPDGSLVLALCGVSDTSLGAAKKLAAENTSNVLANQLYLPEVKAAIALRQHHPEQVKALLSESERYGVASYVPYLEGMAYLTMKKPEEAMAALAPARRWRGAPLQVGGNGLTQVTVYQAALLLTARAQAMAGNKADAVKTYQDLLEQWKTADADFVAAAAARRELAALQH